MTPRGIWLAPFDVLEPAVPPRVSIKVFQPVCGKSDFHSRALKLSAALTNAEYFSFRNHWPLNDNFCTVYKYSFYFL